MTAFRSSSFVILLPRVALAIGLWLLAAPMLAAEKAQPRSDALGDPLPVGAIARLGTVRLRHGDYLRSIRFTPDGKTLISLGSDGIRVWDAATGKPIRHFGAGIVPRSLDLSSDGRRAAISRYHAGAGGPVEVWDVTTGKLLHKLGNQHYSQVCFSPDGKQLAARTNHFSLTPVFPWSIFLWDVESGKAIRTLPGPKEDIWDMQFSTDGKSLILGGSARTMSRLSTTDGNEVNRFRDVPADVHSLVLSPRGDRIAFIELWMKKWPGGGASWGSNVRVFLLDSRTGAELRCWSVKPKLSQGGPDNGWWSLGFSPDGSRLAACQEHGPIRIWDTTTGEEKQLMPDGRQHSGGVAFSPDGKTLAVGDGGRSVRLIDAETGADRLPVRGHRGSVTALALSGDGGTVFTAAEDGTIYRWDARSGRELGRLTGHKGEVHGLALAADGRTLYSAGHDRTLRLWDLRAGKDRHLIENDTLYWSHLKLSPDGKMLAVPVQYKELRLFNAATGECLHRLTTKTQIIEFAFTADASVVKALTGDRTIWRWEAASGRRLPDEAMPPDREQGPIGNPDSTYDGEHIVLSSDGSLIAHGIDDRFLRVIESSTQSQVWRSAKLPGKISTIAFAPDSRTLAWAEQSGVIHWLELATGSERRAMSGHASEVNQIVFTADGKRLVSGSGDTTALVWGLIGQGSASLSAKERDACWLDLADKDAAKAYRAMCQLIATPADALALLRPRLKPVKGVDEKRIERWIADLDADAFAVREKATEELRKLGELAEPACRKALASRPTLAMSRRLQGLLDDITQHQWHPAPEILRQLRAVEVLERIDTPEARKVLEVLAGGAAGARLTREARDAVRRLSSARGIRP